VTLFSYTTILLSYIYIYYLSACVQDLGHYTGARARTSQFREIAKLKKDVNNIDIALSYMARRLLQGDALRHQEPAAASSERVLDALGLGAFYGFLGGFMFHFGISKSLLTDNWGYQQ
jgi:hypothetical protein